MSSQSLPSAPSGSNTSAPSTQEQSIRATKRKLADAFETLDNAVLSPDHIDRPPPPKRANTARSLYTTLAKYGINTKETKPSAASGNVAGLSKSTPHLTAILSRAATRTKKAFPFRFTAHASSPAPGLSPAAEYRPSSVSSFLSRLATYKLATYANKPPAIDAVAASKCGWINDGKDRLVCGLCNASWVVAGREGMSRDAANALIEKQRVSLVESHKNGCPWKTRQCDPSIYCIPLQSPAVMVRDIKSNAIAIDSLVHDIAIKHPLTLTQLNSLRSIVWSYTLPSQLSNDANADLSATPSPPQISGHCSDTAILTSLFGWVLVPPAPPEPLRRTSTASRTASASASRATTPSLSRASSVLHHPRTPSKLTTRPEGLKFRLPSNLFNKRENTMLQCALCQRRIGLWAFAPPTPTPSEPQADSQQSGDAAVPSSKNGDTKTRRATSQRPFDLLKEHRSYCPYVVRSTTIPSLLASPTTGTPGHGSSTSISQMNGNTGALEGWRAVLNIVLRYGTAQRQRLEYSFPEENGGESQESAEGGGVQDMVAGVKSRGGKDLLKYVRGLLG